MQGLILDGTVKTHINNQFFEEILLSRGVYQGCPLSPYYLPSWLNLCSPTSKKSICKAICWAYKFLHPFKFVNASLQMMLASSSRHQSPTFRRSKLAFISLKKPQVQNLTFVNMLSFLLASQLFQHGSKQKVSPFTRQGKFLAILGSPSDINTTRKLAWLLSQQCG